MTKDSKRETMRDFEVCVLVNGAWEFDEKVVAHGRKAAMSHAFKANPRRRIGTIRVRLLK